MKVRRQEDIRTKLLALLPAADFEQVAPDLEFVTLPQGTLLVKAGQPIEDIYFLTSGIGSVVVETPEGHRTEAGLFGFDGCLADGVQDFAEGFVIDAGSLCFGEGQQYRIKTTLRGEPSAPVSWTWQFVYHAGFGDELRPD